VIPAGGTNGMAATCHAEMDVAGQDVLRQNARRAPM
jgi:hypothetical protein